jgi:hypothetical protein
MLLTVAAVPLTEARAYELAGEFSPRPAKTTTPFLVRAVGLHVGTAAFEIQTDRNGDVTVVGEALSHFYLPAERRPVVVWLDQPPREVYLWFSVAE